ncbi:hypothetical protein B0H17DRAFT_1334993 [Mycena rosella]|uniref:Uncharacterized protein n=1 Tax=Mycena rosella TaxID=1033263 RepID=A0AAD7D0Z6_MYCRO|nr:hypothetical protein B0H17DRAFT_1334993 [Mycena rosella]
MRVAVLLPFLCTGVGLVHAIDARLLYKIPAGDNMDTFTTDFDNACATWPPAVAAGFTFGSFLVEPGDFRGKNADTEAKIVCAWTNGQNLELFTTDVASSLGATPVPA